MQAKARGKIKIRASDHITFESNTGIGFKVGSNKILITPQGIEIASLNAKIQSEVQLQLEALMSSSKGKAPSEVSSDAILQLK